MTKHNRKDIDNFIGELEARQRNTVWPDPLRNGLSVDSFLWRGSPNATTVQRIGALVFGVLFIALGITTLVLGRDRSSLIQIFIGVPVLLVGIRVMSNAFSKRREPDR